MSANELPEDAPAPRLCHLVKWSDFDGYGFNLHAEKAKAGQYIGKVDEGSPAEYANLREGDCIVEVNGVNIANENHKQVVERIKAIPNETKLLVVDEDGKKWYKERKLVIKSTQHNMIYTKTPEPRPNTSNDVNGNEPTVNGSDNCLSTQVITEISEESNHQTSEVENETVPPKEEIQINRTEVQLNQEDTRSLTEEREKEEVESSRSSTPQSISKSENHASGDSTGSIPDSPQSCKSAKNENEPKKTSSNGMGDLNLNMSASEMRQLLAARKKHDPKKIQMDLKKKYDIIQQM